MHKIALWTLMVLIFTIPWENAITVGSLGTFTRLIGLVLLFTWILDLVKWRSVRKPLFFHIVILIFLLWNVISSIWTLDSSATNQRMITYLQLAALTLILWDLLRTEAELKIAMQAYIFGAFLSIGSTVFNYVIGNMISLSEIRYAGGGLDVNDLAVTLALGLPIACFLVISSDDKAQSNALKIINIFFIPAAIFAIILTASRTGIIALVPAVVYILIMMRRIRVNRYSIPLFVGMICITLILQKYIPNTSIQRFTTIQSSLVNRDLSGRVALWNETLSIASEHLVVGIGSGTLMPVMGGVAHNTFLSILAELGAIGEALFLMILFIVIYYLIRRHNKYSGIWLTNLIIWVIGASMLSWEAYKSTWLLLSLAVISTHYSSEINAVANNSEVKQTIKY